MARKGFSYPTLQEQTESYGVDRREAKRQHKAGISVFLKVIIGAIAGAIIIIGIIMVLLFVLVTPAMQEKPAETQGSRNYVMNAMSSPPNDLTFTYAEMCDKFQLDFQGRQPVQAFINAADKLGIMFASSSDNASSSDESTSAYPTRCWTIEHDDGIDASGDQCWTNIKIITDDGYVITFNPQFVDRLMDDTDVAEGHVELVDSVGNILYVSMFPIHVATQYPVIDGFEMLVSGNDNKPLVKSALQKDIVSVVDDKGAVVNWAD
jgi:hypothetical protein